MVFAQEIESSWVGPDAQTPSSYVTEYLNKPTIVKGPYQTDLDFGRCFKFSHVDNSDVLVAPNMASDITETLVDSSGSDLWARWAINRSNDNEIERRYMWDVHDNDKGSRKDIWIDEMYKPFDIRLSEYGKQFSGHLSGGQQQRVSFVVDAENQEDVTSRSIISRDIAHDKKYEFVDRQFVPIFKLSQTEETNDIQRISESYDKENIMRIPNHAKNPGVYFESSEEISLVGPSGTGKTALAREVFVPPEKLDDKEVEDINRSSFKNVERTGFPSEIDAEQETDQWFTGLIYYRHPQSFIDEFADGNRLNRNVDLTEYEKHYPSQLSGSQQQRLAIARLETDEENPDPNMRVYAECGRGDRFSSECYKLVKESFVDLDKQKNLEPYESMDDNGIKFPFQVLKANSLVEKADLHGISLHLIAEDLMKKGRPMYSEEENPGIDILASVEEKNESDYVESLMEEM